MAPNGEFLMGNYSQSQKSNSGKPQNEPRRLSMERIQRAMSDLSFELRKEAAAATADGKLPPVSELESATCECCGMSEECTPEYIDKVREKYKGKWICGLCSEAVKEEAEKNGGKKEEALEAHFGVCTKFNRFGRKHPVLSQAAAMKEILKKCSRNGRMVKSASSSPRENGEAKRNTIARSSSCIPAITKDMNERSPAK